MTKRRIYKTQSLLELLVVVVILVVLNVVSNIYYHRFDLTKEKRYTLSETSKNLCGKLKEKLYFKLYLGGEMSSLFKQLRNEIRDMAYEFREASHNQIEIEVIDPLKGVARPDISATLQAFVEKGIEPVQDIDMAESDETVIKYLVPGAEFIYAGKTVNATFFEYDVSKDPETNMQKAIDNIEYEMANALRQCVTRQTKKILLTDGHGEMLDARVASFAREVSRYYSFATVNMNMADPNIGKMYLSDLAKNPDSAAFILMNSLQRQLNTADLLIVEKPETDFSPSELYLIDQYIMHGGKVMWLIDPVHIEMDSFSRQPTVMALDKGLENINGLLSAYGVVINSDLLQDLVCNRAKIKIGNQMMDMNFPYFPLFTSKNQSHVITKGLGAVWSQFPATIKIRPRKNIQATALLTSSMHTRVSHAPATVEMMTTYMQRRDRNIMEKYRDSIKTSGVLLEGKFHSAFRNQKKYTSLKYTDSGNSKMIVIADGDIMFNFSAGRDGSRVGYPTGFDKYYGIQFANKKFLLNCIDYLIDDNGLIEIRGKELSLRLLDPTRIKEEKTYWQILNVALPIGLILLFGGVNWVIRRRRYAR